MQVWGSVSRVITGLQRSGRGGGETPEYCAHFPNMISPSHQPRALGNWSLAWRRIQKPRLGHDVDER